MELVGYIEDEKYGKLAHFIDINNKSIFAKVYKKDNLEIYEELTHIENKELLNRLIKDEIGDF